MCTTSCMCMILPFTCSFVARFPVSNMSTKYKSADHRIFLWHEKMLEKVMIQRMDLIQNTTNDDELYLAADLPYVRWIQDATPLFEIRKSTERLLWHQ